MERRKLDSWTNNLVGVNGFRALLAVTVVTCFIGALPEPSVAQRAPKMVHVRVLFSANDRLCKPLARLYERLSRVRHYASPEGMVETEFGLSWEDEYSPQFNAIGLEQPQPLNDSMHPFSPALSEGNALVAEDGAHVHFTASLRAYYKVDLVGDRTQQMVSVDDNSIGGHGAFGTDVWILKPGSEAKVDSDGWPLPDVVDLGVFFGNAPVEKGAYRHIEMPYYFNKIASPGDRALPAVARARKGNLSIGPPTVVQRLFRFKGRYYFTARQIGLSYALVYRYREMGRIDDVCYLGEQNMDKRI